MRYLNCFRLASFLFLIAALTPVIPRLAAQVTSPDDHFGFKPGADFHLLTYEQAIGYFELIAGQTDRMLVFDMGPTSAGRRMKYAAISSADNLARLDHFKELNKSLSLVRGVSDEQARNLAEEGRTVVWIDGGLHGTEVAPAQLLPQLAYDLITGTDRQITAIRDSVIALLVFANPDGMTIVSDWYMGNVGTPYEVSPIPWLYHKYVGHDNNRDSFMANLLETQNMNRAHSQEWFPEILYNQHQTGPFPARIWIPPDAEPTNPNVHPLIIRWRNHIGTAMGKAFDENDMPGAISRIRYDAWYPGYATQVVEGRNVVPILTETQLYRYATPQHFTVNDFPEAHRDLTVGAFYPNPWRGGWWRIGDAVAYNLVACKAVLEVGARYKYELLYDKYKAGSDVIERFSGEPPYGWIVPADQPDRGSTRTLLDRMRINGIEVYTADDAFEHNGISFPAGTFVLPTSQPFGLFLKNIFERQDYPDLRKYSHLWQGHVSPEDWEGGPLRPYDGVGWTLPLQMGVQTWDMTSQLGVGLTQVDEISMSGSVSGGGGTYVLDRADNNSVAAAFQLMDGGASVRWTDQPFTMGGRRYGAGAFVVETGRVSATRLREIASATGVLFRSGSPRVSTTTLRLPRIGLHVAWVASMDAGWITYIFDDYGIPYESLTNAEIRAGRLSERYDVIIFADQSASQIIEGHRKGTIPADYVGGIGEEGVNELEKFVEAGGTLVTNNASSDLPIAQFDLPIRNVLEGVSSDSFNCPGALLKAEFQNDHPVAYGMEEEGMIFFSRGMAFAVGEEAEAEGAEEEEVESDAENDEEISIQVIASYPDESLLLSGWMIGDERIREKAAALDVSYGEGRTVLFGFNVHNRGQARSTLKMLFNALLRR